MAMPSAQHVEEHTIRADDVTGDNDCPLYLRITAMDIMPYQERVTYVNGGALKESMRYDTESHPKTKTNARIKIWAIINNEKKELTIIELAELIHVGANSISTAKHRALALDPNAKEYVIQGVRFGW